MPIRDDWQHLQDLSGSNTDNFLSNLTLGEPSQQEKDREDEHLSNVKGCHTFYKIHMTYRVDGPKQKWMSHLDHYTNKDEPQMGCDSQKLAGDEQHNKNWPTCNDHDDHNWPPAKDAATSICTKFTNKGRGNAKEKGSQSVNIHIKRKKKHVHLEQFPCWVCCAGKFTPVMTTITMSQFIERPFHNDRGWRISREGWQRIWHGYGQRTINKQIYIHKKFVIYLFDSYPSGSMSWHRERHRG